METRGRKRERLELELESGVDSSAARHGEEELGRVGQVAKADHCLVPRQPSPGEQVLFCKLLRDGILKHFNPYKLRDLQCILELRCFKGVLSDDDLRYCFESVWGFREYDRGYAYLGCIPDVVRETAVHAIYVLRKMQSDPEFPTYGIEGNNRLLYACRGGLSTSVLRALIERLQDVYGPSDEFDDALSLGVREAARGGHVLLIDLLVQEYGAKVYDECLCDAIKCRHVDTARHLLVKYSADVNARRYRGDTPLHVAERRKSVIDVVRLLLEHGAVVNAKDKDGETPLHYASQYKSRISIARLLLEHGADVNASGKDGRTPLHLAMWFKEIDVVRLLLEHGADVNAKNKHGVTPLHWALHHSRGINVARLLLEHGVDVEARNYIGQTAVQLAESLNNRMAANLIREAMKS